MKNKLFASLTLAWLSTLNPELSTFAQGTAFTYQGRLNDGANPAHGTYNLRFALFDALAVGNQVGSPLTNSPVNVSNGLFTVTLDFGNQFPGAERWLEIGVRTNGNGIFFTLNPRQKITPTPYAIYAAGTSAAGLSGTIPTANLAGTYGSAVTFNNPANSFFGNGTGLTNVNAATLGGLGVGNFWVVGGNAGTGSAGLGTVDSQPLKLIAGNRRAFQLETKSVPLGGFDSLIAVNTLGGASGNNISNGVMGGTIAGGGAETNHLFGSEAAPNTVLDNFSTVGGGLNNTAGFASADFDDARSATVAGGENNTAGNAWATVGGGQFNTASGISATVGGGVLNTSGDYATVGGGYGNTASGYEATVGGGVVNTSGGQYATVPGGALNSAAGHYSFAAGYRAKANHRGSFVWADSQLLADFESTADDQFNIRARGGVGINTASPGAMLQIGDVNLPSSQGMIRLASHSGTGAAARYWDIGVPQGDENTAGKFYSFVIDDPQLGTAPELVIRWDTGNVGIGTTSPSEKLHVIGNILASGTVNGGSDRNVKEHFSSVNPRDVLEKVSALPITKWNYITDGETLRHIGPMAQDFYSAFNVGMDDKHISMVDADGVALAAIQGLNQKVDQDTVALRAELNRKDAEIQQLKQRLDALENILVKQK